MSKSESKLEGTPYAYFLPFIEGASEEWHNHFAYIGLNSDSNHVFHCYNDEYEGLSLTIYILYTEYYLTFDIDILEHYNSISFRIVDTEHHTLYTYMPFGYLNHKYIKSNINFQERWTRFQLNSLAIKYATTGSKMDFESQKSNVPMFLKQFYNMHCPPELYLEGPLLNLTNGYLVTPNGKDNLIPQEKAELLSLIKELHLKFDCFKHTGLPIDPHTELERIKLLFNQDEIDEIDGIDVQDQDESNGIYTTLETLKFPFSKEYQYHDESGEIYTEPTEYSKIDIIRKIFYKDPEFEFKFAD